MHHKLLLITPLGFVLAELVVVLAVLAGLAAATLPTLNYWLARERLDAYAQTLLATFSYARSEALKRGVPVTVCRADEPVACSTSARTCSANARGTLTDDWGCGYAIFAEAGLSAVERLPQALRVQASLEGVTLQGAAPPLRFTPPAGQILGGFRRFELATHFSGEKTWGKSLHRCISIAAGGRARMVKGSCKS